MARRVDRGGFVVHAVDCSVPPVSLSPRPPVLKGQALRLAMFARQDMVFIRNRPVGGSRATHCRTGPFGAVPGGALPSPTPASLYDPLTTCRRPCDAPTR